LRPRIGIIGGGYTGAAVAVHLSRQSAVPLDISVVEPLAELGRGVAYGSTDPDHRINGPTIQHSLYPDDGGHFDKWYRASGAITDDPESLDALGRAFARRAEMGRYVGHEVAVHQRDNPSGSSIRHIQDRAVNARVDGNGFAVSLAANEDLACDLLVITTSNAPPALLPPLRGAVAAHTAFYSDPWDLQRLAQIPADARILIVGTGLTMADVAITVLRDRPSATVTAISRRGLLPKSQSSTPRVDTIPQAMAREVPAFVARHGKPDSARAILRALRGDVRNRIAEGRQWHVAVDELREAAHHLWPALSDQEQSRFLRHLAPWYETHRFRFPPQTEAKINALIEAGRLTTRAAAIVSAVPRQHRIEVTTRRRGQEELTTEVFDAVINCTGPDRNPSRSGDPFLQNLVSGGLLVNHPLGLGLIVDDLFRAQNRDGRHNGRLRVIGPLSRGRLGETSGVPHTTFHIVRVLPDILAELDQAETTSVSIQS
jgi:uncharacterized NAD(P)/FAD-binding protein YdhS